MATSGGGGGGPNKLASLRAMFEKKDDSLSNSPPDRGRSSRVESAGTHTLACLFVFGTLRLAFAPAQSQSNLESCFAGPSFRLSIAEVPT